MPVNADGEEIAVDFISHMVQIILLADAPPEPKSIAELYIPHGSDNTDSKIESSCKNVSSLYPTWFR